MAVSAGARTRREAARERRPAVWPWLLMPLVVLLVFYALFRIHQSAPPATRTPPQTSPAGAAAR